MPLLHFPIAKLPIEQISERHSASITRESEELLHSYGNEFPMECAGIANRDKRVVLKALLESPEPRSLRATAAIAGLICFGARSEIGIVTRPHTSLGQQVVAGCSPSLG